LWWRRRATIDALSSRVGRIACDNGLDPVLGTGWRVGPDLLVTNRHVASLLVIDPERPRSEWWLDKAKAAFVDFAYTDETAGPARCEIDALVYCAEERWVDLAVFRVKPGNAPVPPALPIDWDTDLLFAALTGSADRGQAIDIAPLRWLFIGKNANLFPLGATPKLTDDLEEQTKYADDFVSCLHLAWQSIPNPQPVDEKLLRAFAPDYIDGAIEKKVPIRGHLANRVRTLLLRARHG
jgi:hypothetical protein